MVLNIDYDIVALKRIVEFGEILKGKQVESSFHISKVSQISRVDSEARRHFGPVKTTSLYNLFLGSTANNIRRR